MKKILFLFIIITVGLSCYDREIPNEDEKDPCSVLINGVYQYPTEKPDSTLTQEEIREYWNIPEDILDCITTEGLIKSCYKTIYGIAIDAANGYQPGYELVKAGCRGFDELENRPDAPEELISFFKAIELPHHIDYNLYAIEIATAQDSILKNFTNEQKIELLNLTINYHTERREIFGRNIIIYDGTPSIMGRLMVLDKDEQFLQALERNDDINRFIKGTTTYILSIAGADTIVNYTEKYINELNSI
jgi:hypothetical protein